ncbi:MAG: alcohol dehydrogenase [Phycisphaerae bacterium]|nr:alcohol dehydrogenase [Phycisphaerae bacterium]
MKASVIRSFGGTEVFGFTDVETPQPRSNEVLVKVLACGINHYDIFCRRGEANPRLHLPHVMGADVVGEIVQIGNEVTDRRVGQRVIVAPGFPIDFKEHGVEPINLTRTYSVLGGAIWGGYAQYLTAPAIYTYTALPNLPDNELATLPLVVTTAVHAVKTLAQVSREQKILIQAGASGSGAMCLQVARLLGANVAVTVGSDEKNDYVRELGAELVINYRRENVFEMLRDWTHGAGVDAVIDNVGGSVFADNIRSLKRDGHFVNFGMVGGRTAELVFPLIFYKQVHFHGSMMGTTVELLWGLEQVRLGRLRPLLDRTFPLREAARAHEYIEQRRVRGKVVLLPWAD